MSQATEKKKGDIPPLSDSALAEILQRIPTPNAVAAARRSAEGNARSGRPRSSSLSRLESPTPPSPLRAATPANVMPEEKEDEIVISHWSRGRNEPAVRPQSASTSENDGVMRKSPTNIRRSGQLILPPFSAINNEMDLPPSAPRGRSEAAEEEDFAELVRARSRSRSRSCTPEPTVRINARDARPHTPTREHESAPRMRDSNARPLPVRHRSLGEIAPEEGLVSHWSRSSAATAVTRSRSPSLDGFDLRKPGVEEETSSVSTGLYSSRSGRRRSMDTETMRRSVEGTISGPLPRTESESSRWRRPSLSRETSLTALFSVPPAGAASGKPVKGEFLFFF